MSYPRSLLPKSVPDSIDPSDDLKVWQERFLQYVLFGSLFVGLFLSVISYFSASSSGKWTLFTASIVLLLGSLVALLLRQISFWSRSIAVLVIFFFFANLVFSHYGWSGVSLLVLLGFSILSTIFLYRTPTRIGLGISLVTLLFWASLHQSGITFTIGHETTFSEVVIDVFLAAAIGIFVNLSIISLKSNIIQKRLELIDSKAQQDQLAQRIEEQKTSLEKRLFQLKTASEISQKVSTLLDPDVLIQQVADLIKERFDLYYVGVFIIDNAREYAVLKYGTGEAGRRMLAAKHRLAVGGFSMIGWATQTRKPRVALDVGEEAVHFDNPFLPETRSELALPIISGVNILGALSVQSVKENAFDDNDVLILQSVADSIGIALENANSYMRTQEALSEIKTLNKDYVQDSWWSVLDRTGEIKFEYENERAPASSEQTSTIQIPIKIRDEVIGQFTIETDHGTMTDDQLEFVESISSQTSIALENARLLSETQRAALQEQKINEITAQFSKALSIEEIIKSAVMEFGKLPSVSEASISLIPPEETDFKRLPDREAK